MRKRWKNCILALVLIAISTAGYIVWESPADEISTKVMNRGFTDEKVVALTFDDGPHPVTTALLLNVLKNQHIKATFFVVGMKSVEYPDLLRRIAAGGHQVACHTYSHDNLTLISRHEAENELTYWERDVDPIIGRKARYLRPPGGDFDRDTVSLLRQRGYVLSLWSVNPGDWQMPPAPFIVKTVMNKVHPGAIVLMHDDGMNTVRALPHIIRGLKRRGYRFITLEEMDRRYHSDPNMP